MLAGCGRCLLPATLYWGIASAAQRMQTTNVCGRQIVLNCLKWLPISTFRSVCSCSSMRFFFCCCCPILVCAGWFAFSRSRMSHFLNPKRFFFFFGFVYRRTARMCGTDACRPSHIHFLPNNLTFLSFYLSIKNSHKSQKWRTLTPRTGPVSFQLIRTHVRIKFNRLVRK